MPRKTTPAPAPPPSPPAVRRPGFYSFALVVFAVSCLMSLALDFGPIMDSHDFVGGLVGLSFPGVLVALLVAAASFRLGRNRPAILWRVAPPAVAFGLLRALQFAAGLAPMMPGGKPPLDLALIGGVGVFLVGAGLTVLGMMGAGRLLAAFDRRGETASAAAPVRPGADYVGGFGLFVTVMAPMSLLLTEVLVGPALPSPHLLSLTLTAALPLGACILFGVIGFHKAGPERPLGRRIVPGIAAYCVAWTLSGFLTIARLGGGAGEMLLGLLPALAIAFLIAMLSACALYGAQTLVRLYKARAPRG